MPAQHVGCPVDGCNEDCRVAFAPRTDGVRDRNPDDVLGRLDHLAHAEPAAAAEIADDRRIRSIVARRGRFERAEMGVGEVRDVDVVADAGAVGRRVVVAVQRQLAPGAGGRGEDVRDQMGLGVVVLAEALGGAGDVEVAQADRGQSVGPRVVGEREVDRKLRRAVGIGGPGRRVLARCPPVRREGARVFSLAMIRNSEVINANVGYRS